MWLQAYTDDLDESEDFRADLEALWTQMRPFYEKVVSQGLEKWVIVIGDCRVESEE